MLECRLICQQKKKINQKRTSNMKSKDLLASIFACPSTQFDVAFSFCIRKLQSANTEMLNRGQKMLSSFRCTSWPISCQNMATDSAPSLHNIALLSAGMACGLSCAGVGAFLHQSSFRWGRPVGPLG